MPITKADLKNLVTKKDLKKFEKKFSGLEQKFGGLEQSTKSGIKRLENEIFAFKNEMDEKFEKHEEKTETMITKFSNKILNHIDAFVGELTNTREEQIIIGHQVSNHEKRISRLETAS